MADQFFQMTQRNTGNTAWDNLFPLGKFETAGGTATAITLTIPNLGDGISKTFIAGASNSAAATTINGKSLYKPNTTTAPNLIAGKAYTVWYNAANTCFFIKASAEGNTVADHVLAGDTFSNDTDTGLVGTMNLQALNIKEGVTYAGITGILEEKQEFSDYIRNIPNYYSPVGFIEGEGLWCNTPGMTSKNIYCINNNGTISKTVTCNYSTTSNIIPILVTESNIYWFFQNQLSLFVTDKNGTISKTIVVSAVNGTIYVVSTNPLESIVYIINNNRYIWTFNYDGTQIGNSSISSSFTFSVEDYDTFISLKNCAIFAPSSSPSNTVIINHDATSSVIQELHFPHIFKNAIKL